MSRIRKILLLVIVILLVISFSLAISYGYYQHSATNSPSQVVTTIGGMDSLVLENETQITLTGDQSSPISDKKALSSTLYRMTFEVSNNTSDGLGFDIALVPLSSTTINIASVKYAAYSTTETKPEEGSFLDENQATLGSDIQSEINAMYSQSPTTGYIILNDEYLFAGTSKTYNLYVWVDYGEDGVNNSQMNKTFEGIVAITDSVVYNRQGLYTLLNQQQANISTLPKLLTNNHNSIIDLTKNQGVDVNNVTNIYSVDLHKARPDYQNLNMAFFADVDNSDVIVTWTEGNNFFIGERNQIKLSSNMSYAFSNSYVASIEQTQLKSVILRNFNTSKVTNMAYMFAQIGVEEGFNLDLGKNFNTSNVTNMSHIFFWTGDKNFSRLNLGNKFNTANVTDMSDMFRRVGMDSNEFTLELGSHFNTWKVTNMSNMFEHAGYNSTVFTLNLGNHFNTSNVTNMSSMFGGTGRNSLVFTLDLGLKFNTLKVTNMSTMFMGAGYSSPIFKLNLGSQFNTINSSDMFMMFSSTGYSSIDFTLNLNDFVINNTSVDLLYFAEEIGATNIVFGSGWATTGANITNETFYRLKPVNVYYTDTSFHSFRVGNKTMWNRWRGSGNTTFIAGSP